ncbi:AAA family ATPase [Candidatus Woesearchaeota archaeon]|nr:AAA family ATPase [Candidatus Woesearchaeota archaeon]
MKTIIVTGTPGTGKTTLAKKLSEIMKFAYIDANKVIAKYNLSEGYDYKRKSKIIDTKKLNSKILEIIKEIEKSKKYGVAIIDTHLSHYIPKNKADICIVTKCGLKTLARRLKKRSYSKEKIRENMDAEIFDVCLNEAKEAGHKISVIETTGRLNFNQIAKKILREIK